MKRIAAYFALSILVLLAFWRLPSCDFISFDDTTFIVGNPHLRNGFTGEALYWAFSADLIHDSPYSDYWQPMTLLSRIADVTLFGLHPGKHHASNLALHLINTWLILFLLNRMTLHFWRSTFVAGLFALHPLHVESVAWVAERKDLLYSFFWLLSTWAYLRYVAQKTAWRFVAVCCLFALALMSKPMAMTFPAVLLLLDFWPLKRTDGRLKNLWPLLLEKVPLLVLAFLSGLISLMARTEVHQQRNIFEILGNIPVSYVTYLVKTVVPTGLAFYIPHPKDSLASIQILGSIVVLIAITCGVVLKRHVRPYWLVGWLWFLITLVPVIALPGIAWACRFTYLPLVGIFIGITWWACEHSFLQRYRGILPMTAVSILLACAITTYQQTLHWKDDFSLFGYALRVTKNNWMAHNNYGLALAKAGRIAEAKEQFERSIQLNPRFASAHHNLATVLVKERQFDRAMEEFGRALELNPNHSETHYNLAQLLAGAGKWNEAIQEYELAILHKPDYVDAFYNLGNLYMNLSQYDQAIDCYLQALKLEPALVQARNNLGIVYTRVGKLDEAFQQYQQALKIEPRAADIRCNLGLLLLRKGEVGAAREQFKMVLQDKPGYAPAQKALEQINSTNYREISPRRK